MAPYVGQRLPKNLSRPREAHALSMFLINTTGARRTEHARPLLREIGFVIITLQLRENPIIQRFSAFIATMVVLERI